MSRVGVGVVVLMLAVVASAPATWADTTTTYNGSILIAHGAYNAVTAVGAACNPTSPLNGFDGVWYAVPTGASHVTMTPAGSLSADVLFARVVPGAMPALLSCDSMSGDLFTTGYGHTVSGPVPAGAQYVLVNGWIGTGTFTITFS